MLEHDFIAPSINVETLDPALAPFRLLGWDGAAIWELLGGAECGHRIAMGTGRGLLQLFFEL